MNSSSDQIEVVASSRAARLGAYSFVAALIISGVIFKLQPGSGLASALTGIGFAIAFFALVFGACYTIYLAIGSMRAGQFPAPHAHVPVNCKITRGYKARMSSGLMALSGISLAAFAALIVRFAFAS
jgi:hypothetical protein